MRLHQPWRMDYGPIPALLILFMNTVTPINSLLGLATRLLYGRKVSRTRIEHPPLFVLGHWRSGTTLLHELLVLDRRHTFPTTFSCFVPHHFLLSESVLRRVLSFLLPSHRPMDNMEMGFDRPQEDEFALANLGLPSPYLTISFPNRGPRFRNYLDLKGLSSMEVARWKAGLLYFLKQTTYRDSRRIVLKSPAHTSRIRHLIDLFPEARFVHLVRDPYIIHPSTCHLWRTLYTEDSFQEATCEGIEEYVFETLNQMYKSFDEDRPLIDDSRFHELRYEDLVADPVGQLRNIYESLDLGGFEDVLPSVEKYLAGHAGYKTNRYELDQKTRDEITRRWGWYARRYGYVAEPPSVSGTGGPIRRVTPAIVNPSALGG
jgi:hypothetical protein